MAELQLLWEDKVGHHGVHHNGDDDGDDDDDLAGQQRCSIRGRVANVLGGQYLLLIMMAVMMAKIIRLVYNKTCSNIHGVAADCL